MKKKNRIGKQLLVCFLIVIIAPLISSGIIAIEKSKNMQEESLKLTSAQTLGESKNGFKLYLKNLTQQMDALTRKDEFKHVEDDKANDKTVESIQNSLVAATKTTDGAIRAYYATEGGKLINIKLVQQGEKVNSENSMDVGIDSKSEAWYERAIKANGRDKVFATFSDPRKDKQTGDIIITISQKVKSSDNTVGVVAIDVKFSKIEEFIQHIGLLDTGFAVLADDKGKILVNNDKNKFVDEDISGLPFWENAKSEDEGSYEFEANGEKVYITEKTDEITGWKLIGLVGHGEIAKETFSFILNSVVTIVIAGCLGIAMAAFVSIYLMKEINKIDKGLRKVAYGDFTEKINVTAKNEFGDLGNNFNAMVDGISTLVRNVEKSTGDLLEASNNITLMSEETAESATNVAKAIEEVATGATRQAENTEEANLQVDNLAKGLEETTNHTNKINEMSSGTQRLSNKGIEILDELVNKAIKTKENAEKSTNIVGEMSKSIEKINYISNVIAEITEQTNLLSLNASIEAARAGEAGKGFAVVAEEIRELAEQSKNSTDEIKKIVEEINTKATLAEGAMKESTDMLIEQDEAVEHTKVIFKDILNSVTSLIDGIRNIASLNNEMYENKNAVIEKMENISVVSEETASVSEEVTASAEEVNATMEELTSYAETLKEMANKLSEEIGQFKLFDKN
ncbi:methyl-accepting chemotaxis protein [Clostridium sp. HBUAS56017]|uniref:methyl-accepting chemotaxis protein n=1 Tax=Clostridium sp. HBUAS56017 TaxID=2571128 RepID=UPI001177BABC|nr:methyl-accepting chemotaxis protein [Clostridium sp. HBUAS56017]